jgi:hypothetical protein
MGKRIIAASAGALALIAGPTVALSTAGGQSAPSTGTTAADVAQSSVQAQYQTALTNQVNPIAQSSANASATTIINFYQQRISSPGNDTVIAFTLGGTAFSVAANVNASVQSQDQNNQQTVSQLNYQALLDILVQASNQTDASQG